ncbi:MAG: ABC transporter permease [Actinobacteria bacterium]|nr:ABC transporter permease [Actinomycetota bacterium]
MRSAWYIAVKDLLQTRRDRLAALFTIVLPVIFTVVLGLVIGSGEGGAFPLAVADADGGPVAGRLVALLGESSVVTVVDVDQASIDAGVQQEKYAVGLIIPPDFSTLVQDGKAAKLSLVMIQTSSGGQSAARAVESAVERLGVEQLATDTAVTVATSMGIVGSDSASQISAKNAAQSSVGQSLNTPVISLVTQDLAASDKQHAAGFEQSSPGELVNWILFSLLSIAIGVVTERRSGTLRRLSITRAGPSQVIGGKLLAMVIMTMVQQVFLILLGRFAFGVDYFRSPAALVLTMISLSILAGSIGLLIAALFRTEQAVVATTVICAMLLAALGGAWFPLDVASAGFSRVAHFLPTSWVIDAFHGIILQGWGVGKVLFPLAMVWIWIVVILAAAVWRFRPQAAYVT